MKTVSLELSKQLKDAGYPQESAFNWYESELGDGEWFLQYGGTHAVKKWIASPTADELLDVLPTKLGKALYIGVNHSELKLGWTAWYENYEHDEPFSIFLSCANPACMDGKIGLMGLPTTKEALDSLTFVMEFREKANK